MPSESAARLHLRGSPTPACTAVTPLARVPRHDSAPDLMAGHLGDARRLSSKALRYALQSVTQFPRFACRMPV